MFEGNTAEHIDRAVFVSGLYEKPVLYCLKNICGSPIQTAGSCIDVGANVGNHTMFFSDIFSQVYSLEPNPAAFSRLQHHILINQIGNVRLFELALGAEKSTAPLYESTRGNLGTASLVERFEKAGKKLKEVEIVSGDEFVKHVNILHVSLIKIDVEGFEKAVLVGLKNTIFQHRPVILIEMSPETESSFHREQEFLSLFPENYCFYYFIKANKSSGAYRLAPYRYGQRLKHQDIICSPPGRAIT